MTKYSNTRLLAFCPTKNRPDKLKRMLDSFDRCKSDGTEMLVYVSHNDSNIEEYKKVLTGRVWMVGDKNRNLVEIVNYITCELYPNFQYYQCVNDDHIIQTPGYDNILIDRIEKDGRGWGIVFGRSLVNEETWDSFRHPSAEIISGNIPRTLGYYCTPMLQHFNADTFCRDIGEGIKRFYREPSVTIEHAHFINGKAEKDENYKTVYSEESMISGWKGYDRWVSDFKERDINKLLAAMEVSK